MRTKTIQYLYLQRPLIGLIILATASVLCWIGMGDFYTKGEPREASVALSIVHSDNWILPEVYADEVAYKPPLMHWMIAVFSLPNGEVTPFVARLPSALGFIGVVVVSFFLFGRKLKIQEAFLACLILLSSFELHRAAMTARVDMTLTFFIVLSLLCLYKWEVREQVVGLPPIIPVVLGLAALTKGPVGIVLPLLVFGVYLLLLRYRFLKIVGKLVLTALCSLVVPAAWYVLAYQQGDRDFLDLFWAENFGRFLNIRSADLNIRYNLGHEEPWWYNFASLAGGFIPWTIPLFISLFYLRLTSRRPKVKAVRTQILSMEKVKLFSLTAVVVIFIFYCFPAGKRSVYLMPLYPFLAVFLARFILYLVEYRPVVNRIFSWLIGVLGILVALVCLAAGVACFVGPAQVAEFLPLQENVLYYWALVCEALGKSAVLSVALTGGLLFSLYVLFYQLRRKNNLKLLYSVIGVYLCINLVADGLFLPAYKTDISSKPSALQLKADFPLDDQAIYVMNNLQEYSNMYGLNFYLGNRFRNFEKEMPAEGFFLTGKDSFQKVLKQYGKQFRFQLLREIDNRSRDGERVIQFYSFKRAEGN